MIAAAPRHQGLVAAAPARQCLSLYSTAVLLPVVTGVPCSGAPLLQGCGACATGINLLALRLLQQGHSSLLAVLHPPRLARSFELRF